MPSRQHLGKKAAVAGRAAHFVQGVLARSDQDSGASAAFLRRLWLSQNPAAEANAQIRMQVTPCKAPHAPHGHEGLDTDC